MINYVIDVGDYSRVLGHTLGLDFQNVESSIFGFVDQPKAAVLLETEKKKFFSSGMSVLGISAYYHDSAAALVGEGRVLAAAQEERFTRGKHDARFPSHAVAACLGVAGLPGSGVDAVVFYDQPWLKFKRLWVTFMAFAPEGREPFCRALPRMPAAVL